MNWANIWKKSCNSYGSCGNDRVYNLIMALQIFQKVESLKNLGKMDPPSKAEPKADRNIRG